MLNICFMIPRVSTLGSAGWFFWAGLGSLVMFQYIWSRGQLGEHAGRWFPSDEVRRKAFLRKRPSCKPWLTTWACLDKGRGKGHVWSPEKHCRAGRAPESPWEPLRRGYNVGQKGHNSEKTKTRRDTEAERWLVLLLTEPSLQPLCFSFRWIRNFSWTLLNLY